MADDLNFQNISSVQNAAQPKPRTIASTTTIAPTGFLTLITGTTALGTITPPVTGAHMLVFIHTDATPQTYVTTGNILNAVVPTSNLPTFMVYDPAQAKYYGAATNLT